MRTEPRLDPTSPMAADDPLASVVTDHREVEALFARAALGGVEARELLAGRIVDALEAHARLEEQVVYPAARALLSGAELARMGQAMRARRTAG